MNRSWHLQNGVGPTGNDWSFRIGNRLRLARRDRFGHEIMQCYHRTISEVNRGENQADCIAPQLLRTCIYTCPFRGVPLSTHRTLVSPFSIYYTLPNFHPTLTKPTSNHFTMQGSIQLVNQACSCAQVRTFPYGDSAVPFCLSPSTSVLTSTRPSRHRDAKPPAAPLTAAVTATLAPAPTRLAIGRPTRNSFQMSVRTTSNGPLDIVN
jgi:hypothetical protein